MRYILEFLGSQPNGYNTYIADLLHIPSSRIQTILATVRHKWEVKQSNKELLCRWISLAESKTYIPNDFIW